MFNNFHVRETFKYPDGNGDIQKASFNDLNQIYKLESSRSLRAAHKLTAESLNPSSAAKVSPKHALGERMPLIFTRFLLTFLCEFLYFFF